MNFLDPRLPARFWSKCIPEPNSGCWLWLGATSGGRGQIRLSTFGYAQTVSAYRFAVSKTRHLPDDLTVDHLCENPLCVNPAHCDVVPSVVNIKRHHDRHPYTMCINGHDVIAAGWYVRRDDAGNESRRCRQCQRDAIVRWRATTASPERSARSKRAWDVRRAKYGPNGRAA